jgi:hypothetical protein
MKALILTSALICGSMAFAQTGTDTAAPATPPAAAAHKHVSYKAAAASCKESGVDKADKAAWKACIKKARHGGM